MSIRSSDISRWPLPPSQTPQDKVRMCLPHKQSWPVMSIHNEWLITSQKKYQFDSVDEILRHLIYTANSEPSPIKKLIFKTIRCLHCHVGARADQHLKINLGTMKEVEVEEDDAPPPAPTTKTTILAIHTFHYEWLYKVTNSCNITSIEKCIRIIIDYYQSRVKQVYHSDGIQASMKKELDIFGKNRIDDPRFQDVLASLKKENEEEVVDDDDNDKEEDKEDGNDDDDDTPEEDNDPAACSKDEMVQAIQRCQVGRNSKSYSIALQETPEQYQQRRTKELIIENSDEAKAARKKIEKAFLMSKN
ncbi:hypothetical protein FRACYDRAFT_251197 [Fragilariopsis cylindrus CCMP1102]|uniref:Uncharacterized protein n=1 Tax=Fragilariopsis cylindrus CCMP1102 TaxID=635003 RepID=A0A1E7EN68_9STRA|nr:hypothetical protein FRACYDRAFT_251197 [Fragilariopsis cylindrus CCMP1102]|eukprot:OEU07392.1 hypothetical protein FRACYDRAFT_251197 [Fragilariopsis cylindrus CCMP1102]